MSATVSSGGAARHAAYVLRSNPVTAVAAAGVAALLLTALLAPWLVPYDPVASNVPNALQPPSAAHWAGTDQLGRDIWSRLIAGSRLDLAIAFSAVASPSRWAPRSAAFAATAAAG